MADTSASGADDSNIVQVQVLLSAPSYLSVFCFKCAKSIVKLNNEMWLSLVAFFLKRRLWRMKREKKGAAVVILRQTEQKITGTANVSCQQR